jgi:predicted phosphodiesterase
MRERVRNLQAAIAPSRGPLNAALPAGKFPLRLHAAIAAAALLLALVGPNHAAAELPLAWVELVGPGRQASIRIVVSDHESCPTLMADGEPLAMRVRAEPGRFLRDATPPATDAAFPVRVCEAAVPEGKQRVLFGQRPLPLPPAEINRIVVFGDTGCRIKKDKKPQDCASADKWPYAKVAAHAAKARPDLAIHVGDYLYRELCEAACSGAASVYGWDGWLADFFAPSAPLLAAAPWIMVRGNHEDCSRAADGWFRFLARQEPQAACADMSPFFLVDLGGQSFVVMDSSAVADASKKMASAAAPANAAADDDDDDDDEEAGSAPAQALREKIHAGYEKVAQSIPPRAWLLTHSPFYGVRHDNRTGEDVIDNSIEMDAIGRTLSPDIAMIVSGHIHMFEA